MPSIHSGMNVSRRVIGGNTTNQVDPRDGYINAPPPILQKAVVVDVISDYNMLTQEYKEKLLTQVGNFELIEVIPINSIIAKVISNEEGNSADPYTILFPFFSSHFMLPVQVGEVVHVIYQDYSGRGNKLGFWLSRIHGNRQSEDVNYTHLDRQFDAINDLANWSTNNLRDIEASPDPGFPNGGDTIDTYTIAPFEPNRNPYDDLLSLSEASKIQTPEVVPRWNKRPQEFVIQGSNNALICLGEDRSGGVVSDTSNEDLSDSKGFSGTIDMVVGRGRFPPTSKNEDPELTAPRVISNSRNFLETDKAPHRNKNELGRIKDNPKEGDPDFINDAARLYVTMQSVADNKFGITSIRFPESTFLVEQPEATGTNNRSYVFGKADHIRFIARKNSERGINGSLLFLREGDPSDSSDGDRDLSYILINKHGTNIESKKIFLGTSVHVNPAETSSIDYNNNEGPYEPYILWSKYRDTVENLQSQINDLHSKHEEAIKELRNKIADSFQGIANAMLGGGNSVPYGPNSAVIAASAQATAAQASIRSTTESALSSAARTLNNKQNENNSDNVSKINHSQVIYGAKGKSST